MPKSEISAKSEGEKRTLVMKSPVPSFLGLNSCKADVESDFSVVYEEVKGDKLLIQGNL